MLVASKDGDLRSCWNIRWGRVPVFFLICIDRRLHFLSGHRAHGYDCRAAGRSSANVNVDLRMEILPSMSTVQISTRYVLCLRRFLVLRQRYRAARSNRRHTTTKETNRRYDATKKISPRRRRSTPA